MTAPNFSTPSSCRLEVARVQAFPFVFTVDGADPEPGTPWDHLPKATLVASSSEPLRDVMRRACRVLGVRAVQYEGVEGLDAGDRLVYAAFWRPADDEPGGFPRLRTVVAVRDEQGQAIWRRPALEATIGELLDAYQAGLLDGDPRRPYLVPSVPQGDVGIFLEAWRALSVGLDALYQVLQVLGAADGALALAERLKPLRRRRTKESVALIRRMESPWESRGAAPGDLIDLLAARPRSSEDIAALLGCAESEAEAILWALGFSFDDDARVWRHKGDAAAQLLADDVALTLHDRFAVQHDYEEFRARAETRLRQFAAEGQAPTAEDTYRELSAQTDRARAPESGHESARGRG